MRRLPYGLTEEELIEQLGETMKTQKAFNFVKADLEMLPYAFARAYFAFEDESDAISFCKNYNGYVFVDKKGIF